MKRTIATKRADVVRAWVLACYGNDERYYTSTLWTGIPDGENLASVLKDMRTGEYDEYLDGMIDLYTWARSHYGKYGYYYHGTLYTLEEEDKLLEALGVVLPEKILKTK